MDKRNQAVTVAVRVRPLRPDIGERVSGWNVDQNMLVEKSNPDSRFSFDYVFTKEQNTREIYDRVVAGPIVQSCMGGFNATVFAYGQTSSGKSFTMLGEGKHVGIVPYAVEDMFSIVAEQQRNGKDFVIKCSMLEIYNEQLRDLLAPPDSTSTLRIVNSPMRGVYVDGAVRQTVTSTDQFIKYIHKEAEARRVTASHSMSERSSRSHCIVRLDVECWETSGTESKITDASFESDNLREVDARGNPINIQQSDCLKMSALHLVDLAGSERISKTGATGDRKKEGANINKSLLFLGTVIEKLSDPENRKKGHIPYRDSVLTRILQTALGGNSVTTVIAAITEAEEHLEETRSTLKFAFRASQVKNVIHRNEINDDKSRIKNLEKETRELRKSLVAKQLHLLSCKLRLKKFQISGSDVGLKTDKQQILSLQATNSKLTEELDLLTRQGGGSGGGGGGSSETITQLNAQIEMLQNQIHELEEDSLQLQQAQEELEKLCEDLESDNDLKTKKVDRFRKEKRQAQDELESTKLQNQELQDKIYQLTLGNKQQSEQLEAELGKAHSQNDSDLQKQVAETRSKYKDLEQKYAFLQDQYAEAEAQSRKGAASQQEHDKELSNEAASAKESAMQQAAFCRSLQNLCLAVLGKPPKEDKPDQPPTLVKEREMDQITRQLQHFIDSNRNKPPAITASSHSGEGVNQIHSSLRELQGALDKRSAVSQYADESEEFPDIPVKIKGMSISGEKPAVRATRRTTASTHRDPTSTLKATSNVNGNTAELAQKIANLESSLAQRDSHRDIIIDTKLKRMQDLVIRLHTNNLNMQSEVNRLADESTQLKEFIAQRKLTSKLPSNLQAPTLSGSEITAAVYNKPVKEHPNWRITQPSHHK
eukprot:TRINITY_DN3702_c4_g1_i1.p1 TRINITY_DN3702_c4_g1~~TRINITY_DN3702_c4_g1_i1.p1  ORF type:complete len:899 (+),score=199.44 TRINITY_DN3702_c4_g1_i1:58-2697(+)